MKVLERQIQTGHEEQRDHGREQHAPAERDGHRYDERRFRRVFQHQRRETEEGRDRGQQNRPEPDDAGARHGFDDIGTVRPLTIDVIDHDETRVHDDAREHRPDQLSGGERQRVAIARATIMHPAVLLADEPTGNLDSVTGQQVIDLLEQLNLQGVTLLVVTHDSAIGKRAGRQIRLVDGRITGDIGTGAG